MRTLLVTLLVALAGCVGPTTTVRTVDTRPARAFRNAPHGAVLYVDGVAVGAPAEFDGRPRVLRVEPGTHDLEIRDRHGVVFSQRVFVEGELKIVEVR